MKNKKSIPHDEDLFSQSKNSYKRKNRILIVDDDRNTREGLERALKFRYEVILAPDAQSGLNILKEQVIDLILSDIRMPGLSGMEFLEKVKEASPDTPFILLTAYGSVEVAVEAMRSGAYDFLQKPVDLDQLELRIERALETKALKTEAKKLATLNADLQLQLDERFGVDNIIGSSEAMEKVFKLVKASAPTNATILVSGESGTGKELIARSIHKLSRRSNGPFIAVNCAALPATLLESELFGHEKGAFTGAEAQRKGRFELASGGTLFLDEIGEIDHPTQVKLLRVLEDKRFERVGGTETIQADIRLVTATNKNLKELVANGTFREDLYYRLVIVEIPLPPLKERTDDIPLLAKKFLKDFANQNEKNVTKISNDAINKLCAYEWPGNVRELRNTIERMVVLCEGDTLTESDIPENIREAVKGDTPKKSSVSLTNGSLQSTEKDKILAVLEKHNGNRTRAAIELGISRRTIIRKLEQYNLESPIKDNPKSNLK